MAETAVRVLLVDDDEEDYLIVNELLQSSHFGRFDLSWAPTYERGMEAIRTSSYDVCLIDFRLGPRSGLELLAEVTAKPDHPQVILLTGAGHRIVDVAATSAGAADYLVKGGLTAAMLERSIRHAVERGRTLTRVPAAGEWAFRAETSGEISTRVDAILATAERLWESPLNIEQRQYVEVLRRAASGLLTLTNLTSLTNDLAGRATLSVGPFVQCTVPGDMHPR